MCCRRACTKPILLRKEMKTATPPNGVTARSVSRRINRSSDNRAVISRGTGLSVAFDSIPLLSQIRGGHPTWNFAFQSKTTTVLLLVTPLAFSQDHHAMVNPHAEHPTPFSPEKTPHPF